jgi:RimJ/RimL family protein N-acetyltransferase
MPTTPFHITTPRLLISHLDSSLDSHCDFLVTLYNTESTRARNSALSTRSAARQKIDSYDQIRTLGYGRYLVSLKPGTPISAHETPIHETLKSSTKIGVVSMHRRPFASAPCAPDVGFNFLPEFQGHGYATEAAGALVRWFEEEKGQKEFFGFCDEANEGSKGVLRRIGFECNGVREIRGLYGDGGVIKGMVFSKGLLRGLEEYGL